MQTVRFLGYDWNNIQTLNLHCTPLKYGAGILIRLLFFLLLIRGHNGWDIINPSAVISSFRRCSTLLSKAKTPQGASYAVKPSRKAALDPPQLWRCHACADRYNRAFRPGVTSSVTAVPTGGMGARSHSELR